MLVWDAVDAAASGSGAGLRNRMTDRRFYLLLTLVILALAGGEIVYAVWGPFSAPTHQIDEFSSSNRVR
jgi:hypothetical protein